MAQKKVQIQLMDERTGEVIEDVTPLTEAESVLYTNPTPTVSAHGGIPAGSTFDNVSVKKMLDDILYPYTKPTVSLAATPAESYSYITDLSGATGIQGPKGDQGAQGPAGKDGAAGPQGPVGPKGDQGLQGPAGADGKDGDNVRVGADYASAKQVKLFFKVIE